MSANSAFFLHSLCIANAEFRLEGELGEKEEGKGGTKKRRNEEKNWE